MTTEDETEGAPEDIPYARPADPIAEGEIVDQLAERKLEVGDHQEALIDETVEDSFPASDPPSFQSQVD